jgi:hypothetical protein
VAVGGLRSVLVVVEQAVECGVRLLRGVLGWQTPHIDPGEVVKLKAPGRVLGEQVLLG